MTAQSHVPAETVEVPTAEAQSLVSEAQADHHWRLPVAYLGDLPQRRFARWRMLRWLDLSCFFLVLWARTEWPFLELLGKWCLARAFAYKHGMVPMMRSGAFELRSDR